MSKQTLSDQDRREIVLCRLEKSERTYNEAVTNIQHGFVEIVANRLYYAAYYAVTAFLIAGGNTVRTHSGVRTMFGLPLSRQNYWTENSARYSIHFSLSA